MVNNIDPSTDALDLGTHRDKQATKPVSMQSMLEYIERWQRKFANHPFFTFASNPQIDPIDRLKFAPFAAPFVLGVQDLFRFSLTDEHSPLPLQQLVNRHCQEERGHADLYLADLGTISTIANCELRPTLELMWGQETVHTRRLLLELISIAHQADANLRILVLESLEAAQRVAFQGWREAATTLQASSGCQLHYFIGKHEQLEEEHGLYQASTHTHILEIQLTPEEANAGRSVIDRIFHLFFAMFDEWLTNATSRVSCSKQQQR